MSTTPRHQLGNTGLRIPPIVFGTSTMGNLFEVVPHERNREIVEQWFAHVDDPVFIDSAGKYGAGLALEELGKCLEELGIAPERVVISNKLAWVQTPLTTPRHTFEPEIWVDLKNDAVQRISYDGILECWEQGCQLLGGSYRPQMVSVHDPDEYLAAASDAGDRERRLNDILEAYRALGELKKAGEVAAVGVGAKDWQIIAELDKLVQLDWVMIANCLTIYQHPTDLLEFTASLASRDIGIINSAVFHAGFLLGGKSFNYTDLSPDNPDHQEKFVWRDKFNAVCQRHGVKPVDACVQFGLSPPGVHAIAFGSSKPKRIESNVASATASIPPEFWSDCRTEGLIASSYSYL